jgi:hypothetical protein
MAWVHCAVMVLALLTKLLVPARTANVIRCSPDRFAKHSCRATHDIVATQLLAQTMVRDSYHSAVVLHVIDLIDNCTLVFQVKEPFLAFLDLHIGLIISDENICNHNLCDIAGHGTCVTAPFGDVCEEQCACSDGYTGNFCDRPPPTTAQPPPSL